MSIGSFSVAVMCVCWGLGFWLGCGFEVMEKLDQGVGSGCTSAWPLVVWLVFLVDLLLLLLFGFGFGWVCCRTAMSIVAPLLSSSVRIVRRVISVRATIRPTRLTKRIGWLL
jgi:hypothetical protein